MRKLLTLWIVFPMGAYYVLDPALNNQSPILVEDWFNMMGNVNNLTGMPILMILLMIVLKQPKKVIEKHKRTN